MSRLRTAVPAALVALAVAATGAAAHKGNPNFESTITARTGLPSGVTVEVVNRDDSLALTNRSDRDIVVLGYESEPYARIAADGTVSVNENSTATYLNEDRYGKTSVPDGVTKDSPVKWKVLDRSARFSWHDHRIHWMADGRPPQVKDPDVRTKVFDWKVDLRAGSQPAAVAGVLTWTPSESDGGAPVGAIAGFVGLLLASLVLVVLVRRRRSTAAAPVKESW